MYEIHLTVNTNEIEKFKTSCATIGVKPIVLDLQDKTGNTVFYDVMTSSKYSGPELISEVERIEAGLIEDGFEVIRKKIECSPILPFVPSRENGLPMPKGSYFESHLRVLVNDESLNKLRELFANTSVHVSRNIFKEIQKNQYQILLTLRKDVDTYEDFKYFVDDVVEIIKVNEYVMDKLEVEYVLYDSNKKHDSSWLKASYQIVEQ